MSEEKDEQKTDETATSKKLFYLLGAVVVILNALVIMGIALVVFDHNDGVERKVETKVEEKLEPMEPTVKFYNLDPTFIVNFKDQRRLRYLKTDVVLVVSKDHDIAVLEPVNSLIRAEFSNLFASLTENELISLDGKKDLQLKCHEKVNVILKEQNIGPIVDQVLFTKFIIQ